MNKKAICAMMLVFSSATLLAIRTWPFQGGGDVKEKSPDIIFARCLNPPGNRTRDTLGLVKSKIQVLGVLKGHTNTPTATLRSLYLPCPEHSYLIFANFHDGLYDAIEAYRFVPLGLDFATNQLVGKTVKDQIHAAFRYRLDLLDQELKELQEEKSRLEKGL